MKSISHSATEKYENCPKSYFFHYVRKLRPTGKRSPLCFGDAIDTGLNTLLSTRDLQQAVAAFTERWTVYKTEQLNYSLSDFDESLLDASMKRKGLESELKSKRAVDPYDPMVQLYYWTSLLNKGIVILEEYATQALPQIKTVLAVQQKVTLANGEGQELTGYIDLIAELQDGRRCILDNKTTSVRYEKDSVQKSPQLATYYAMMKETYNLTHAGFIVIPKAIRKQKKPRIEIEFIVDLIPDELVKNTFARYDLVLGNIRDGNFERNLNGCKNKFGFCEYYNYCHKSDKTGLVEEV